MLAPIFFHPARTQPVDPLLNRRVPPSPEKEKTGRDRRRMNKKRPENSLAPDFFHSGLPSFFFQNAGSMSGRLLTPLFPILSQPVWNYHSPQEFLDSRAPLRGLLRNSPISLSLKSLHELFVIPRQAFSPTITRSSTLLEDSCKSLSVSPSPDWEHSQYSPENVCNPTFDIP